MKKNSLWVALYVCVRSKVKGQKNIIFQTHQNLDWICCMTTIHRCVITRRVPFGPQVLSQGGTFGSSSAILGGYSQVLTGYPMGVPLGPQVLSQGGGGTHRSSRAIIGDTHRSSSAILGGYPQVLKGYPRGYPWVLKGYPRGYPWVLKGYPRGYPQVLKGYPRGVPIRPEASRAIKRKAKICYGYKAVRSKVTWTVKVYAI